MKLGLTKDLPVVVEYAIEELGYVRFYLVSQPGRQACSRALTHPCMHAVRVCNARPTFNDAMVPSVRAVVVA